MGMRTETRDMAPSLYTADSLADVEEEFRRRGVQARTTAIAHPTHQGRLMNDAEADTWFLAADILSKTTIVPSTTFKHDDKLLEELATSLMYQNDQTLQSAAADVMKTYAMQMLRRYLPEVKKS